MASQVSINEDHLQTLAKLDLERGGYPLPQKKSCGPSRPQNALVKDSIVFGNESFNSSTSTLTTEKEVSCAQDDSLPEKRHTRVWRNLRYTILQVYHRLSILILMANVAAIVICSTILHPWVSRNRNRALGIAVAANLTAAVLIRQDLVINLLFALVGKCPTSMPLRIRCMAAKIYHLGGVHAGAAVSGSLWFLIMSVDVIKLCIRDVSHKFSISLLVVVSTCDLLLLTIIVMSHPKIRARCHNTWEVIHRFAGWAVVGLLWAYLILSSAVELEASEDDTTIAFLLGQNPAFWLLFITTVALILPWLRLRRVPVRAEALSTHAVRLHLGYTNVPLCTAPKFSISPLREWHAFAAIPQEDGSGFSIIVSRAGDWTKRIIDQPPKELWTKGVPARGVLHVAPIFKRLILVATGSGIGPILSLLYARNIDARIIWSTPDPSITFNSTIVDQVRLADPEAVIINTTQQGRPDLVQEAYRLYKSSNAEAIFVISNPVVTRKVVYGLESRGIPTFAPIFDS